MENFTCYLAGKMGGISYDDSNVWRVKAKQFLEKENDLYNVRVINPNDYYNFKEVRYKSEKEIIRFDLHKVRTSNLVLVNLNGVSIGTSMEAQHAFDNGIPVLGYKDDKEELHCWLDFTCDRVFDSLDELLEYVKEFYLR